MVSVVHWPLTLYRTRSEVSSDRGNGGKGSRTARREDLGSIWTSTEGSGMPGVARKAGLPSAKPADGRVEPFGGENLNGFPDGVGRESVMGLKVVEPEYVIAVMSSGEARKFMVERLPSFRPGKFRL